MSVWFLAAASPFKTGEEFAGALDGPTGGAIYTFADRPALIGIMVVLSALIFLYFIYASFNVKAGESTAKSPEVLGVLLLVGAASAMMSLYETVKGPNPRRASARQEMAQTRSENSPGAVPALLGMTSLAGLSSRRKRRQRPRKYLRNL